MIGVARREWDDDYMREQMRQAVAQALGPDGIDERVWADSPAASITCGGCD